MSFKAKTNTVKQILAKVMLLALLVTGVMSLSGCWHRNYYAYYRNSEEKSKSILLRVNTSVNVFEVEKCVVDLEIGLHKISWFGKMADNPRSENYQNYKGSMGFLLYICNEQGIWIVPENTTDIYDLKGNLFVKMITEEQAFSKEYGYSMFKCNHIEQIKIPSSFLAEEKGIVVIKLIYYFFDEETEDILCFPVYVELAYRNIDDNQIEITNLYKT